MPTIPNTVQARNSLAGELWGSFTRKEPYLGELWGSFLGLGQLWVTQSFLGQLFSGQLRGQLRSPCKTSLKRQKIHQQRMGAGVWCRHAHDQEWSVRVGRETEGTNSKRPELAALASTLRAVHTKSPLLYLCDNEAVLQDITKWIGEGHKTSMALNKDADIMNEIIQRLPGPSCDNV